MISINTARNTVMFLLRKANRGFITPEEFDSFCDLAQMDILEGCFDEYANWLNKKNRRLTNLEYADRPRHLQEIIDIFSSYSTSGNFTYDPTDNLWSYSGSDLYRATGVTIVNSTTGKRIDCELVGKGAELNMVLRSNTVAPSLTYPIYVDIGGSCRVYPTLASPYGAELLYIRRPKYPKWSYTLASGNPVYNAGATDLQNIELPNSMFAEFIVKVMGYCGITLREADVVAVANQEEMKDNQKQA